MTSVRAVSIGAAVGALIAWLVAWAFAGRPVRGDMEELLAFWVYLSTACGAVGGGATAWALRWRHRGAAVAVAALTSLAILIFGVIILIIRSVAD